MKINPDIKNMYIVMDFDGTITKDMKTDSWDIAGRGLGKKFKAKMDKLFNEYRPIEIDYQISYKEKCKAMEEWYNKCINLYYEYGLTQYKLKEAILNTEINLRDGIKEFFKYMYENDVPVIIVSAGIGNVIRGILEKYNCFYKNMFIISNFLEFDSDGNMKKFDGHIINSTNKNLDKTKLGDFAKNIENRKYKVLLGDLIEDKNMVNSSEWDTTLSIGFLDDNMENLPFFKKEFDIVLTKEKATYYSVMKALKIKQ